MAIINVSYDTKTKQFDATINGVAIDSVDYITIGKYYDEEDRSYIDIRTRHENKDEDIVVYTNLSASKKDCEEKVESIDKFHIVNKEKLVDAAYTLMGKKPPKA